jgi:hypothetical protein
LIHHANLMTCALIARLAWPKSLIHAVRTIRSAFAWVSEYELLGVPLDWLVRFVVLGVMYTVLRRYLSRRWAAWLTIAVLLGKELFDLFAHQDLLRPPAPNWGDLADVISGLLGLGTAMAIERLRRGRRPAGRGGGGGSPRQ